MGTVIGKLSYNYGKMNKRLCLACVFLMICVNTFCEEKNNLFPFRWSSYTTYFQAGQERAKNIRMAVEKLDGFILHSGSEFSFNETVTWQIPRDTFGYAPAIIDGKLLPAPGGGLCQVSSTLYAAVLAAGLSVTERKNHSSTVGYISPGLDATVSSTDNIDLKFCNKSSLPFIIRAELKDGSLTVVLLSSSPPGREVNVSVSIDETKGPCISVITTRRTLSENGVSATEIISRDEYIR